MYNVLGSYKSIWYPVDAAEVYAGEKSTVTSVADPIFDTVPSVLVVLPVVPVTYTVSFTENILEEVTVKTTEDAAEGLPEVEAPVCFRPSY